MSTTNPYQGLEASIYAALETYANVHRGSGHFSKTTTHLYEKAREITLSFMGLKSNKYVVIFLTTRRFAVFTKCLKPGSYFCLHSRDFSLNLGVSAMAVRKNSLPAGPPRETGGGTTKLYGADWVMWANAPDRFEAGTPAIINIIAFAKALMMISHFGKDLFREKAAEVASSMKETTETVTTRNETIVGAMTLNKIFQHVTPGKETIGEATTLNETVQHVKTTNEAVEGESTGNETVQEVTARKILYEDHLTPYRGKALLHELRNTLIGRNVKVPTTRGMQPFVNFDNSASTQSFEPVWEAFRQAYRQPENIREKIIEEVKGIIAETMGAPLSGYDIHFTSNTTEAINLAAQSLANETSMGALFTRDINALPGSNTITNNESAHEDIEPVILTTNLEHSSNDLPWRQVAGHNVIRLGVDNMGFFDHYELESLLRSYNKDHLHGRKRIRLVSVSGASNVLGSCNDLEGIGSLAQTYGARLFVDAAQLTAHRKIDMQTAGIDYLAFSAHKVYAPFGVGVLIARKGLLQISDEENAITHNSALENAGGIVALGKALLIMNRIGFDLIEEEEKRLTRQALNAMNKIPGMKIHGALPNETERYANKIGVIPFEVGNKMPSRIAQKLSRRGGIGVRMGCHCAHLIIKQLSGFTPFQEKLQKFILRMVPMLNLQGITRISFGIQNTDTDIDLIVRELTRIAKPPDTHVNGRTPLSDNKEIVNIPESLVKKQMKDFIRSREREVFQL